MSDLQFNNKEEFEKAIIEKCWKDDDFKDRLMKNPIETINNEFNFNLKDVKINIIETKQNEIVIGIPSKPVESDSLTEEELEKVNGGTSPFISIISCIDTYSGAGC